MDGQMMEGVKPPIPMELHMSEIDPRSPEELVRQVRQHLESLRSAGVEYLPAFTGKVTPLTPARDPRQLAAAQVLPGSMDKVLEKNSPSTPKEVELSTSEAEPSLVQRRKALVALTQQVSTCTRCSELACTRTQTVFGDGQPGVDLCFVGEAPGADEDAQGKPFVGAAGQLLDRIIVACGMKREEVYICNIIKCRPPGNRTPRPDEAGHCREYLEKQLELVRPRYICALGGCAAQNLLNTTQSLGKLRGRLHSYKGIPVLVTYHPAYLLPHRSPQKKKDVWEDMKFLMAQMGRPVQGAV
jgi:uracil-DNA glycosylase family 4